MQYHVERHDILKRDVAGFVAAHQDIVDNLWAAAGRESEYEGPVRGWLECLDARWTLLACCAFENN